MRWYFYGGVNEERKNTEKKAGMELMELLYRILVIIKQLVMENICGVMDYESDTFQLKGSIDKGRLVSKVGFFNFKRGSFDELKELISKDS